MHVSGAVHVERENLIESDCTASPSLSLKQSDVNPIVWIGLLHNIPSVVAVLSVHKCMEIME